MSSVVGRSTFLCILRHLLQHAFHLLVLNNLVQAFAAVAHLKLVRVLQG